MTPDLKLNVTTDRQPPPVEPTTTHSFVVLLNNNLPCNVEYKLLIAYRLQ